ncbi:MAG: hypothetical protein KGD58_09125 [Candidatus Lokiarchaeota archaeon]|nr:hypothetical protein [Candidatus Lokiarchaeota archaeon]
MNAIPTAKPNHAFFPDSCPILPKRKKYTNKLGKKIRNQGPGTAASLSIAGIFGQKLAKRVITTAITPTE